MTKQDAIILYDGKFDPLHEGHIELLQAAIDHFTETHANIYAYICPIGGNPERHRKNLALIGDMENVTYWVNTFSFQECNEQLLERHPKGELIQIAGTDSKIPHAFIIDDGSQKGGRKADLTFKSGKAPLCSSVLRFLTGIQSFQPHFLRDSGIVLGGGCGGVVKLMFLGRVEVAVKLIKIGSELDIKLMKNEGEISLLASEHGFGPKVYTYGMFRDHGYIVTEILYPWRKTTWKKPKKMTYPTTFLKFYQKPDEVDTFRHEPTTLPPAVVIRTFRRHVAKLHSLNIVHRDLHPDQLMLTRSGELKLIDYGLSKVVGSSIEPRVGNLRYYRQATALHPEKYSFGDDLYAVNKIASEIITGEE